MDADDEFGHDIPTEGFIDGTFDFPLPPLSEDDVLLNPHSEVVVHENQVFIDFGASDSMVPSL